MTKLVIYVGYNIYYFLTTVSFSLHPPPHTFFSLPFLTQLLSFQLQRLKRSLSFKTKSIRSKSADNFFRTSSDNKTELLSDVSSSTGHLCNIGMAPPHTANLPIPPVPPAIPCAPPPTSRSQARNPLQVDSAGHCFMEHIFKKPTFCDVCNHMIVGMVTRPTPQRSVAADVGR